MSTADLLVRAKRGAVAAKRRFAHRDLAEDGDDREDDDRPGDPADAAVIDRAIEGAQPVIQAERAAVGQPCHQRPEDAHRAQGDDEDDGGMKQYQGYLNRINYVSA